MKRKVDTPHTKMVEAELLRQSEERFCQLAEQLPGITYIVELLPEPHTVYISPQVKPMLGFTQQEWLSTPPFWIQQVAPEDRERIVEKVLRHNGSAEPFFLEYRILTRDGNQLWIRNSATYQRNAEGIPITVHGVMQDITEKKEAETALLDSELRFRHLLREVKTVAIQGYSPDGTTQYWNQASERLYGYTAEEAIGRNLLDLIIPPEMREDVRQAIQTMMETEEPIPAAELSLMRKDGSRVSVHSSHVVVHPPGHPLELFCVDIDLTERQEAEQAQKENRERYQKLNKLLRSVADVMPDMLWAKDLDRKYIFANRAMCEGLLFAQDTGEPIGKTDLFFAQRQRDLRPDDPDWHTFGEICADSDSLVLDTGTSQQFEESGNIQGKFLLLDVIKTPLLNEKGDIIGTVGTGRDVTKRNQAEVALRESEAQNRALTEAIPDLIVMNRRDGEYLFIHAPHPEMLIAPPEKILHRRVQDLMPPDIATQCLKAIEEAIDTQQPQELQYTVDIQGEPHTFEARVAPSTADTALTIIRDITERKQAEATLDITQKSYLNLLNSITEAIYVQDSDGFFIDVNKGAERMYGYSREELIGMTPADVAAPGRNDIQQITGIAQKVFETGIPAAIPFWAVRKNGEVFPKDVRLNKGTYFGQEVLIAVARDISQQVKAESEKERLQAQLLQSQKLESVGRLAGGVAHDFNNLLQAIFGNAELALDVLPPDSPAFDNVEEVRKTAKRSAELTKQLLAFARKQAVIPQVLHLDQTIESMINMLKRLIGEGIQLKWVPQIDLPPVKMDPTQIDQILVNLCLNARDSFAGEGCVTIKTEAVLLDEAYCTEHAGFTPGEYVHLTVQDNGSGMETDVLEHIFEPFFSTKKMGHGTGLGLATVYGIIQQNNGIVRVDSDLGQGTTFHIYLPVCHESPVSESQGHPPVLGCRGQETILLVEDDVEILRLTETMLKQFGYSVSAAASPLEAIQIAKDLRENLHLLLTDVVMPEMNGHDLANEIQTLFPKVKCLFMSGYTADIIARQGILDEGVHFFQKPFTRQELAAKVRTILDSN